MNLLAIGAYERDNFGDLLFLFMIKNLLPKNINIVPSSIIFSDMRNINGEIVLPYNELLKKYKFDAIYVAGGEIGAVNIKDALMMDIDKISIDKRVNMLDYDQFNDLIKTYTGVDNFAIEHAYMPDLKKYNLNSETPLIINSVGLSKIKLLKNEFLKHSIGILKDSNISVRDKDSLDLLYENKIKASLSPDIVHAISAIHPKNKTNDKYYVFQINSDIVNKYNYSSDYIAETLLGICNNLSANVKLFLSGTASFHDSIEFYTHILDSFNMKTSNYSIEIINDRNPLKLVDHISASIMWIGTSLHGRIISIAYNIPRISIENEKVARYAHYWDDKFPSDVNVGNIIKEVEYVSNMNMKQFLSLAKKLSLQSKSNLDNLFSELKYNNKNIISVDNIEVMQDIINTNIDTIIDLQSKYQNDILEKNNQISTLVSKINSLEDSINIIKNSTTWKIGAKITNPAYKIKKTIKKPKE